MVATKIVTLHRTHSKGKLSTFKSYCWSMKDGMSINDDNIDAGQDYLGRYDRKNSTIDDEFQMNAKNVTLLFSSEFDENASKWFKMSPIINSDSISSHWYNQELLELQKSLLKFITSFGTDHHTTLKTQPVIEFSFPTQKKETSYNKGSEKFLLKMAGFEFPVFDEQNKIIFIRNFILISKIDGKTFIEVIVHKSNELFFEESKDFIDWFTDTYRQKEDIIVTIFKMFEFRAELLIKKSNELIRKQIKDRLKFGLEFSYNGNFYLKLLTEQASIMEIYFPETGFGNSLIKDIIVNFGEENMAYKEMRRNYQKMKRIAKQFKLYQKSQQKEILNQIETYSNCSLKYIRLLEFIFALVLSILGLIYTPRKIKFWSIAILIAFYLLKIIAFHKYLINEKKKI